MTPVCFVPVVSPDRLACHLGQRRIVLIEQESYRKIVDNSDLSFGRWRSAGATRLGRGKDYHLQTERGLDLRISRTILATLFLLSRRSTEQRLAGSQFTSASSGNRGLGAKFAARSAE